MFPGFHFFFRTNNQNHLHWPCTSTPTSHFLMKLSALKNQSQWSNENADCQNPCEVIKWDESRLQEAEHVCFSFSHTWRTQVRAEAARWEQTELPGMIVHSPCRCVINVKKLTARRLHSTNPHGPSAAGTQVLIGCRQFFLRVLITAENRLISAAAHIPLCSCCSFLLSSVGLVCTEPSTHTKLLRGCVGAKLRN